MDNGKGKILSSLKRELGRLLIMSFGVFLFILFFQPFPLDALDYDNRLLFVTGFGAIYFLVTFAVFIILPLMISRWFPIDDWEYGPTPGQSLLFLAIASASFAFYIRYVGKVNLSFYMMFKVLLVNLLPLIILILLYRYKWLKQAVGLLQDKNKEYLTQIEAYENGPDEEEIDIISENKSDRLKLKYNNIVFIKSADNYIEINYLEKGSVVKKMLRSTMRNIEHQLADKSNFLRCHRTHIVNASFIEKLLRNYGVNSLKIKCCEDIIPVSKQYLIPIKVAITGFK